MVVSRSAAGAALGVAEETPLERVENRSTIRLFYSRCASAIALA